MNASLDIETEKSFLYLKEVEEVAQEILTDKENKLDIANAQNTFRVAFRELQKTEDRQSWIQIGSIYVKLPKSECIKILSENITNADVDLKNLDEKIRTNVSKLRDLEHQPRIIGMGLKPISGKEANAITKAFGYN